MEWSGRAPAPSASKAGKGRQRRGARHVLQARGVGDGNTARRRISARARQAILALEPDEPVFENYERQDIDAWPVRNEIAPVCPTGRGERCPNNLEIFGAIGIGADDQRRAAVEGRMVFHFVLDAGLARGNERRLGIGCGKIDEPRFRCFVIVGRNIAEASRRMATD
jgi:hypothetical protein